MSHDWSCGLTSKEEKLSNCAVRTYRDDDLQPLAALINAADRVDNAGFSTTESALAHQLQEPSALPKENVFVAEQTGRLVGYVIVNERREEAFDRIGVIGIVHPEHRLQGIGSALMQRAESRARELRRGKPLFLEMVARQPVAGAAELALSVGMQPVRHFFYMQCSDLAALPEPVLPAGICLRRYIAGSDEDAFVKAYNDGFSDHWGYVPHTREKEEHRVGNSGFVSDDTLLAVDSGGRIAGLCVVLIPPVEPDMREANPPMIDDLAVTHAYRRRGLGRGLLRAGMRRIRDQGFSAAALAVDVDSPNRALRLYESVGFRVVSASTAFRKELK
jgi:mycothiol synthase